MDAFQNLNAFCLALWNSNRKKKTFRLWLKVLQTNKYIDMSWSIITSKFSKKVIDVTCK